MMAVTLLQIHSRPFLPMLLVLVLVYLPGLLWPAVVVLGWSEIVLMMLAFQGIDSLQLGSRRFSLQDTDWLCEYGPSRSSSRLVQNSDWPQLSPGRKGVGHHCMAVQERDPDPLGTLPLRSQLTFEDIDLDRRPLV